MLHITIPKPCYQHWPSMQPGKDGRHCSVCSKTVVDFTQMDDDAVKQYFIEKGKQPGCGRFRKDQLQIPTIQLAPGILQLKMPGWKVFLTACLLAFSSMLFSCESEIRQGEPMPVPSAETAPPPTILSSGGGYVGMIFTKTIDTTLQAPLLDPGDNEGPPIDSPAADSVIIKAPAEEGVDGSLLHPGIEADSSITKNPPAADSLNCNNKNFL